MVYHAGVSIRVRWQVQRLFFPRDDGIVVWEEGRAIQPGRITMKRIEVHEYFGGPESMKRMELVHGFVREPPAPRYGHQSLLTHLGALLDRHVRERHLGQVCVAPVDVVLDEPAALVVQPDIIFVTTDRLSIVRERVFGPPDLVVEVLSPGTARRDRTTKLAWYRRYGVRECWLVDLRTRSLEVVELQGDVASHQTYTGNAAPRSMVLPQWAVPVEEIFD
jgi:Uma2 family endonuclease